MSEVEAALAHVRELEEKFKGIVRTCIHCKEIKGLDEFSPTAPGRLRATCKQCERVRGRKYYQANRERLQFDAKEKRDSFTPEQRKGRLASMKSWRARARKEQG